MVESLEPRTLLSAAPIPLGPVTVVTNNSANQSVVAIDQAGDYVVVYSHSDPFGHDSIFADRFTAAGVRKGGEITVATSPGAAEFESLAVAMDARGDFVVTWQNSYATVGGWISANSFNYAGVSQGGPFRVSPQNSARTCSVAMDPAGDFVVSWFVGNEFGAGNPVAIYAQRYNSSGLPQSSSILVNTIGLYGSGAIVSTPSVAMEGMGNFVIAWESNGSTQGVSVRRFNFVGTPLGDEFRIFTSTINTTDEFDPVVAMDRTGDFVVTWHHPVLPNDNNQVIQTQRFNAYGFALGNPRTIDSGNIVGANVVMDAAGNFFEAWSKSVTTGISYLGQSFSAAGTPIGIRVISLKSTVVAMNATGAIVNTWIGVPSGAFAQRYTAADPLFNHAPIGTSKTVTGLENTAYVFKVSDFGFSDSNDVPANSLKSVKIVTLPARGTLTDNGVLVVVGAHVPVADISGGKLKFTPLKNQSGAVYAIFKFQVQDNGGTAHGGTDTDTIVRTMTINIATVKPSQVVAATARQSLPVRAVGLMDPHHRRRSFIRHR